MNNWKQIAEQLASELEYLQNRFDILIVEHDEEIRQDFIEKLHEYQRQNFNLVQENLNLKRKLKDTDIAAKDPSL